MDWKSAVFRFCVLFAGNEEAANDALVEAFVQFARNYRSTKQATPVGLFRTAYRFLIPVAEMKEAAGACSFPQALLTIPAESRATLILWSMKVSRSAIAEILEIPTARVPQLLISAVSKLRDVLPSEFFERSESLNGQKNQAT